MELLRKPLEMMSYKLFVAARVLEGPEANVIICPFILTAGATMLYYATEGSPFNQLERVLHYDKLFPEQRPGFSDTRAVLTAFREAIAILNKDSRKADLQHEEGHAVRNFKMVFGSQIFIQEGAAVKEEFLEKINKYLTIRAEFLDFAENNASAYRHMQDWMKQGAQDRFDVTLHPNMVDPFFKGSRMVIANAAHYRAGWAIPFHPAQTTWETFYLDNKSTIEVEMMHITEKFPYGEDLQAGFQYIEIPYAGNDASLIITISSKKCAFNAFLEKVGTRYQDLNIQKRMKLVKLSLPRFKVMCRYDLKTLFNSIGIKEVLEDGASFINMSEEKVFRICEGFHMAAIAIDEDGTFSSGKEPVPLPKPEAHNPKSKGSGESSKLGFFAKRESDAKSKSPDANAQIEFNANQPFLIAVRHNRSSAFLFSGCIMSP